MVYLKTNIDEQTYRDLKSQGSQAINDYGFEYLYNKGYIVSDKEYKGCHLRSKNNNYEMILNTEQQEEFEK